MKLFEIFVEKYPEAIMDFRINIVRSGNNFNHWQGVITTEQLAQKDTFKYFRKNLLPNFAKFTGVQDIKKKGMRLVIDVLPKEGIAKVKLFSGKKVPNACPQDWTTPKSKIWEPDGRTFFDVCAESAAKSSTILPSGDRILLIDPFNKIYSILDCDPKADTHFLMLSIQKYSTMLDKDFTHDVLFSMFNGAQEILRELDKLDQTVRFVANIGRGYQAVPRPHLHVLTSAKGLPKLSPESYKFELSHDGTVKAPAGSEIHRTIIELIERRRQISGYSPESKQARKQIDKEIFDLLNKLI